MSSFYLGPTRNNCSLVRYRFPAGDGPAGGGVGGTLRGEVLDDRLVVSALRPLGEGYHRPIPRTTNLHEKKKQLCFSKSVKIKNLLGPWCSLG